ncbi:hypothetical protein niasHT_023610 [Heterodera trifolii]|uniref:Inhibitor of growth protein n=1 Tax=Heterodera trifolii TaxID=157864 RepID=A0ABD2JK66_9BILA
MEDLYEKCLKNSRPIHRKMEENLYDIRVLDVKAKVAENELRQKMTQMANTWKKTGKDERKRKYEEIEEQFAKANDLCNEKIQLAESTYEMVDAFIQKLDKETSSFNAFVKRSKRTAQSTPGTSKENIAEETSVVRRRGTAPSTSMTAKRGGTSGRTSAREGTSSATKAESVRIDGAASSSGSGTQLVGKGDMPIDPNEPRYCTCQQVSFGHMVGCDNKECPLEWFHFECVGLKASPKGKWYCPKCREYRDASRRQQPPSERASQRRDKRSGPN